MMRNPPVRRPLNILEEDGPLPGVVTPLSPRMGLRGVSAVPPQCPGPSTTMCQAPFMDYIAYVSPSSLGPRYSPLSSIQSLLHHPSFQLTDIHVHNTEVKREETKYLYQVLLREFIFHNY